jgi:uncharacterized membrane protein
VNERTKKRLLHGLIAAVIASVGAILCAAGVFWGGALGLVILKPRDDQDAWGPLFGGIFALPVSWVVLFVVALVWLGWRSKKREAAQPDSTIPGDRA